MVEAVARHGFASTTVRELVTLAGVSKSTFYEHFESKEDCFLATFDSIVARVSEEVGKAYGTSGPLRERLIAGLGRFMELVVERPEVAAFATIESLTLGSDSIAHRAKSWESFEQMTRRYFVDEPFQQRVSDLTVRAMLSGISGVVYQHLRSGKTDELPKLVEPLIDWVFSYQEPDSDSVRRGVAAAERPPAVKIDDEGDEEAPGWEEPPDSPLSRSALSQRQRIIRAAARIVAERGYEALSIPAISAAAGTSNQTFYENFNSKREAFLAAYDIVAGKALRVATEAFESTDDGPEAVGAGLRALTEYIAGNRMFARLAFVEMLAAGPLALDRSEETMNKVLASFEAGAGASRLGSKPSRVVLEATSSGVWYVIQREIAAGREGSLPDKAPELARLSLLPLDAGA